LFPLSSEKDIAEVISNLEDLLNNKLIQKIPYIKNVQRYLGLSGKKKD
jgi:hypothetical protein